MYSRPIMEFDRIHLKEAIVMWPDMHSFFEFDKFEAISNFKFLFEKLITIIRTIKCFSVSLCDLAVQRADRQWGLARRIYKCR